ncbi:MAG: outer membrane protein assembly factor BamB family protein, partial [Candidatus Methanofastidiosia archaeon]
MSNRQSAILYCICFLFVSSVLSGCISNGNNGTVVPTTTNMPTTTTPASTNPPDTVQLTDVWELDLGGEAEFPPILVQGAACVVTDGRILLVLGEGDVLWDRPLSGETKDAPVSDGDSIYLVYTTGSVERRDGATGEVVWTRSVGAYPQFAPMCVYGDSLYVPIPEGYLLRLLVETGDVVWRHELPESPASSCIVPCGDW